MPGTTTAEAIIQRFAPEEPPTFTAGDTQYLAILDELRELHCRKAHDYGSDADPLANVRASAELGVAPWHGALLRAADKWFRLKRFVERGTLANEGVEDTLKDMAAYLLIALRLYREQSQAGPATATNDQ